MENQEKTKQTNNPPFGCFESSSFFGKMMMKMMKKMCGSMEKNKFNLESMMKEMNCCSESK